MVNESSSINTRNKTNKNNAPTSSATPKQNIKSMDELYSVIVQLMQ